MEIPAALFAFKEDCPMSMIQVEKDMQDFSEELKKKVLLARSLCQQAHLYIWDEPLNYSSHDRCRCCRRRCWPDWSEPAELVQ